MPKFLNQFSTFRLIILFLLALGAGLYLLERRDAAISGPETLARGKKIYGTLLDCADEFGKRLSLQKSLAVALVMQHELLDDRTGSKQLHRILRLALEKAPECIQGVGFKLPGAGAGASMTTFLRRDISADIKNTQPSPVTKAVQDSACNGNFFWTLLDNPPGQDVSRFSSLVALSLPERDGLALVQTDMDWLAGLLRQIEASGGSMPLCAAPGGEIIWLKESRLVFDGDFHGVENFSGSDLVELAKKNQAEQMDSFLRADILGSGWALMVPTIFGKAGTSANSLAITVLVIALGGLLLEMATHSFRRSSTTRLIVYPDARGQAALENAGFRKAREKNLLALTHEILFNYRIINPNQERLESELRVARQIQFSLIPERLPESSKDREFDLYSVLKPAREVSGDYYDFFMFDSNRLAIAVGDVSGKGVPAALYMAVCRTAFRTLAPQSADPGELMAKLNDMLVRDNHSGLYVTLAAFFVDLASGKCEYVLAGHPAPLLYRHTAEEMEFVDQPRESFVGMEAGLKFPVGKTRMSPGDTLLLYTDGVTEARNGNGEDFDYSGLRRSLRNALDGGNCKKVVEGIDAALGAFCGDGEQEDDITLLAFRYLGRKTRGLSNVFKIR